MKLHNSITEERICAAVEETMFGLAMTGICTACGEDQEGCEPDARGYICESCGKSTVYGAEELLLEILA